ncbi:hypothetical protein [Butyrivibrio fibrisolvens]|uniref:hypothetical protein n=1 Tax=Butyrivibrio fibrisolvens TaxID=831 RepID=UPI0003B302B2|nr:hypothetical protein [Butyrivibrio fibrisolvens]
MSRKPLSREEIREKMSSLQLENIYQLSCNTTTKIGDKDSDEYYSEVMSEYVLEKIEQLQEIKRNNVWKIKPSEGLSYFSDSRINITQAKKEDDGKPHFDRGAETILCRDMYIRCKKGEYFGDIGKILDFQTPLARLKKVDKEPYKSRKVGKVDLISYSSEEKPTIWLLEVKNETNKESMYRCVMEGFTYLQTIDQVRYIKNLKEQDSQFDKINAPIIFRTAPLIAYKGKQFKEMEEASGKPKLHKNLLELMHFLDISIYFSYEIEPDKVVIRKHII